jgi:hypothetical protein
MDKYTVLVASASEFIQKGFDDHGLQPGKFYFAIYMDSDPGGIYWSDPYNNEDEAVKGLDTLRLRGKRL